MMIISKSSHVQYKVYVGLSYQNYYYYFDVTNGKLKTNRIHLISSNDADKRFLNFLQSPLNLQLVSFTEHRKTIIYYYNFIFLENKII